MADAGADAAGGAGETRTGATVGGTVTGGGVALVALSVGGWPLGLGPTVVGGAVAGYRSPSGRFDGAVCGFAVGILLGVAGFVVAIDTVFGGSVGLGVDDSGRLFGAMVLAVSGWPVGAVAGYLTGSPGRDGDADAEPGGGVGRADESAARARR